MTESKFPASLEYGGVRYVLERRSRHRAVYRSSDGASTATPTGRVFVRFGDGSSARARARELSALGYSIAEVPEFAPHSAWLVAASGGVADALVKLDALRALHDVKHAEPELARPLSKRSRST